MIVVGPAQSTPARTFWQGASGETVQTLQLLLTQYVRGVSVTVDGDVGPQTEAAVREFQQARHLTVAGIVGPQTWQALLAER